MDLPAKCPHCGFGMRYRIPLSPLYDLMSPFLLPLAQRLKEDLDRQQENYRAKHRDIALLSPFIQSMVNQARRMITNRVDVLLREDWIRKGGEMTLQCPKCDGKYALNMFGGIRPLGL